MLAKLEMYVSEVIVCVCGGVWVGVGVGVCVGGSFLHANVHTCKDRKIDI